MDTLHIAVCDNHVSSLTFITSEITRQMLLPFLPAKMSCAVYRKEYFLTCTF